jgi:hypothetical protein
MSQVDELFDAFKAARAAGGRPRAADYLDQVEGRQRQLLGELISKHVDAAPAPRRSLADIKADPIAQQAMAAAEPALRASETWPVVLPAARHEAQLARTTLVQRLADALGVGERAEKVGDYYHRMETGTLPPAGVSSRVLEALGTLLGTTAEQLREAGARTVPPAAGGGVFARGAGGVEVDVAGPAAAADRGPDAERDEVDRLFLDGE